MSTAPEQFQIVFVGGVSEKSSADSVAIRWGKDLHTDYPSQVVAVIDSGQTKSDLEALLAQLDAFPTDRIDHLVATHSDNDHIAKMPRLADHFDIGQVWAHNPWNHLDVYDDPDSVQASARDMINLRQAFPDWREPEPGTGSDDGVMLFVGPTIDFYRSCLPKIFRRDQLQDAAIFASAQQELCAGRLNRRDAGRDPKLPDIEANWVDDNLSSGRDSSAANRAGVLTLFTFSGRHVLLTGDADAVSLEEAAGQLNANEVTPSSLAIVQIPHHGSFTNLSTDSLTRIAGEPIGDEHAALDAIDSGEHWAVAMTGSLDPHHPSERVLNAFVRRGRRTCATLAEPVNLVFGWPQNFTEGIGSSWASLIESPRN